MADSIVQHSETEGVDGLAEFRHSGLSLEQVEYSIRVPEDPGEAECSRCGDPFPAAGPTGYANNDPICDLCLLECEEKLGMVLALVSVARAFAVSRSEAAGEHWEALEELGVFTRVYELVATRSGPPRMIVRRPGGMER